ncbi:hypothetical protein ACGE24_05570 [Corynebacterium kroppenstedtii]|uniref:hypothetical protein n=1 Tax=Corynebacterium sp. PCR 32 TaxID=3351342 RepID=UPI0030ADA47B
MTADNTAPAAGAGKKHDAGAFDIRSVIAILLGIYGLVLIICSFALDPGTNPDTGESKSAADNLWVGIGLVVVAGLFVAWARIKPIIVDEAQTTPDSTGTDKPRPGNHKNS